MEKFILRSQNTVSKYNWSTQVLIVSLSGMSLFCVRILIVKNKIKNLIASNKNKIKVIKTLLLDFARIWTERYLLA